MKLSSLDNIETENTETQENKGFFEDAVLDENQFFVDFAEPLEEFEPPEPEPEPEQKESFFEPEPQIEIIDPKVIEALNKDTAEMIVSGVDIAGSFVLAHLVAQNDNTDDYKLPKEQRKKIAALIQKMMPTQKTVMPNWMLLALTVINSYGELTAKAVLERQVKKQEQRIKELEAKLKEKE